SLMTEKEPDPQANAKRKLEHTAGQAERVECHNQLATPRPPDCVVLVLRGDGAVVVELLNEQRLEFIGSTCRPHRVPVEGRAGAPPRLEVFQRRHSDDTDTPAFAADRTRLRRERNGARSCERLPE